MKDLARISSYFAPGHIESNPHKLFPKLQPEEV
jgi:hypothetical protein